MINATTFLCFFGDKSNVGTLSLRLICGNVSDFYHSPCSNGN
jgi:hypothetical protein